jgi:hypothetical protein
MHAARRLALLLTASPLAIALATAASADVSPLPGHFTLQGFGGDEQGGTFSAWLPVIQAPGSVFWASPYAVFGNESTAAGFGLGYRTMVSPSWAVGGYAFIDGSAVGAESWLWQGTLGAEAVSNAFEARANVYLPLTGNSVTPGYDVPDAILNADNMLEIIRGHRVGATAVDGEVGVRVLKWGQGRDGLRAFAGAYSTWRDGVTTSGFSGRLEARWTKPDNGISFTVAGGASLDRDGRSQFVGLAGFSMPLGGGTSLGGGGSDGSDEPALDADPVHHLGAISTIRQEHEQAYFENGRPTGAVQFADGNANTGADGLTVATATALGTAVTRTGENGVIVAVGGNGDLNVPSGQTLMDGQAIVGGGAYLPLAAADGTTGFSWHADGTTAGTIARDGSGYVLSLADYNTIVGVGIQSTFGSSSYSAVVQGGIYGYGTTGASISQNTISVSASGLGVDGEDDDQSASAGASATGGAADAGIDASAIYGINLEGARDADVGLNQVTLIVNGGGGVGGDAIGGSGGGAGGNAMGGAGGRGIALSDIIGISMESTRNSYLTANTVDMTVAGVGGLGGGATAGNAAGGAQNAAGIGTGGAGGVGIDNSNVWGIYADGAREISIVGNTETLALTATGGLGGVAQGGKADVATTDEDIAGKGIGGRGGQGVHGTTFGGISASYATDVTLVGNDITVTTVALGAPGGQLLRRGWRRRRWR